MRQKISNEMREDPTGQKKKLFRHEDSKAMKQPVERDCGVWSSWRFSHGYGLQELDKALSNLADTASSRRLD